jgi:hypothetical protein
MGAALTFGLILGGIYVQENDRLQVSSLPPHELSINELIRNGPGGHRHVTLVDFIPAGYVFEAPSTGGKWSQVWVALFPAGKKDEIKVVLSSKSLKDEASLRQYVMQGRITGICSQTERTSWGTTLGPELVKSNQGATLTSAWNIEELRQPPSAGIVNTVLWGSYALLGLTMILALAVFGTGRVGGKGK